LIGLAPALSAQAHTRSESHSVWEINGPNIDLVMTIPELEVRRLSPSGPPPSDDLVKAYLTARVYPTAGGKRCALEPPVETLSATPGFRKYDFTFRCGAGDIAITSGAFFDLVASHTNFAQIQNAATGEFTEQLITRDRQTVEITGGESGKLQSASFLDFMRPSPTTARPCSRSTAPPATTIRRGRSGRRWWVWSGARRRAYRAFAIPGLCAARD
jgi:hypothetical protein